MKKPIKFDLLINEEQVATLDELCDQLRDHFTTEILEHWRSGLLAKWLRARELARELEAVERLADDDAGALKALYGIFKVEAEDFEIMLAATRERAGHVFRDGPTCPEMVVVPAGSFMMGTLRSEEGRDGDEGPIHRVTISEPFAVGVYAVTFDEWDACVRDGRGCGDYWPDDEGWGRGRRPVINVSWEDAKAYVSWLNAETGKAYRLLSEAEWEYVARAGTTTPFHTGQTISTDQANYDGDYTYGSGRKGQYRKKTIPVGSFPANDFGLHDVHGNVWEWVEDCWHGSYADAPESGVAWTCEGDCSVRVMRGGSWYKHPDYIRSGFRRRRGTSDRDETYGFRVARTLS